MLNQNDKAYGSFDSFDEFFQRAEERPGYWAERAKLEFTEEVSAQMKQQAITRSQLASALDVQPSFVTRLLSGRNNFELATMVRLARALNCEFRCHLQPQGTKTCWIDVLNEEPQTEATADWNPKEFRKVGPFEPRILSYDTVPVAA